MGGVKKKKRSDASVPLLPIIMPHSEYARFKSPPPPPPPPPNEVHVAIDDTPTPPSDSKQLLRTIAMWTLLLLPQFTSMLSIGVLVWIRNKPWYSTDVQFPQLIRELCNVGLELKGLVKEFWVFVSDPDFQNTFMLALPQLGGLMSTIYRILVPATRPLNLGYYGGQMEIAPTDGMFGVMLLVPLMLIGIAIALQVFPEGRIYAQSKWFWAVSTVLSAVFLFVTQLTADIELLLWFMLFDTSTYKRIQATEGTYALIAQVTLVLSSLFMFIQLSLKDSPEMIALLKSLAAAKQKQAQPGGLLDIFKKEKKAPEPVLDNGIMSTVRQTVRYIIAPAFVLTVASLVMLVLLIVKTGSPIKSVDVVKIPTGQDEWLVLTPNEKMSGLGYAALGDMLNPEAQIAALGLALVGYLLEKMGTWGCFDTGVPGVPDVCVSDLVSDLFSEVTSLAVDGLKVASDIVTHLVIDNIPQLHVIDDIMNKLKSLQDYADFTLFTMPHANLGLNFKLSIFTNIFSFSLPSLPDWLSISLPDWTPTIGSTTWIVCLVLLILAVMYSLWRASFLGPAIKVWIITVELMTIAGVVAVVFTLGVLIALLQKEIANWGYKIVVEWYDNSPLYGINALMFVACMMLRIGESHARVMELLKPVVMKKLEGKKKTPDKTPKKK